MSSFVNELEAPSGGSCSRSQSLTGGELPNDQTRNASHGIPLIDAPCPYDDWEDPSKEATARTQPSHQKQKLIVLCDGTWKSEQTGGGVLTNVSLLARCIKTIDRNGVRQVTEYQPGLGTGTTFLGNWREGLTGTGLYEAVREAYCFIARNYYDNRDEICLIGFSRGAFTVRATAQFIHEAGLLTKDGLVHVLELFELWKDQCKQPTKLASFKTKLEAKGLLRSGVQIRACAVWDTVSSLGFPFPGFLPQPAPQKLKFVNSNPSPNVFLNIQALSLQERRRHFHPIVMRAAPSGGVSVQQCWFLGYHSDIGGGRLDNALSVFPLIWIMSKLNMFLDIDVTTIWPINPQHVWGIIRDIRLPDAAVDAVAESLASATSNNTVANRLNGFIEFHKLNQLLEVSFNQERSARGFKQKIKDSMTFAFKAGGSWPRMPCRDLYNDEGPYQQEQQIAGAPKHETIHWSVRSLKQCSAIINDEPPLRDATFDYDLDAAKYSDNIKCTWDFKDKEKWWKPWNFEKEIWWKVWAYKKERPSRQVNEANFSALECSLLAHWFCHELTVLKQEVAKDLASELLSSTGLQSFVVAILQKGGHRLDMWGELPTEILP